MDQWRDQLQPCADLFACETPGVIGEDGVYLAGSTLWYPYFNTDLVSFNLNDRDQR